MSDAGETYNIREWEIEKIPLSCSMVVIGAPQSGKGTFIENVMYWNKNRIPVGRFFTGSETQYNRFKKITHPLYCSNYYSEDEEKNYIVRQRQFKLQGMPQHSINVIDDVGDDATIFRSKTLKGLFKIGTQHWEHVFILSNQYAIDFPPDLRKTPTFAVLFHEPSPTERLKLYNNFGGITGSFEMFSKLMDEITGNYTCMVIARTQSTKIEDNIFWYRTKKMDGVDWKFGCSEYHQWAKLRYNKNFKEKVMM
jgi:hypothetical protein